MKNFRKKVFDVLTAAAAIAMVVLAVLVLGGGPALTLARAVLANLDNPAVLTLTLLGLLLGLMTSFGVFIIVRWFAISDGLAALGDKMSDGLKVIDGKIAALTALSDTTSTTLKQVLEQLEQMTPDHGVVVKEDLPEVWRGFFVRLWSFNIALKLEATIQVIGQSYRIMIEPTRFETFFNRFVDGIALQYLVFVPSNLGFGCHPVETLLKLVFIMRACRARAAAQGIPFKPPRIFMFDGPRAYSSFFVYEHRVGHTIRHGAKEYFRDPYSKTRGTPTSETKIFCHTSDEEILRLENTFESYVSRSLEIDYFVAEKLVSHLLSADENALAPTYTASDLNILVTQLYRHAVGKYDASFTTGDHFSLGHRGPSIHFQGELPKITSLRDSEEGDRKAE